MSDPSYLERMITDVRTDLREDLRTGFAQVNSRLDQLVPHNVFAAHLSAVERRFGEVDADLAELKQAREQDKRDAQEREKLRDEGRRASRSLAIGGITVPVVILIVQLLVSVLGVGGGS